MDSARRARERCSEPRGVPATASPVTRSSQALMGFMTTSLTLMPAPFCLILPRMATRSASRNAPACMTLTSRRKLVSISFLERRPMLTSPSRMDRISASDSTSGSSTLCCTPVSFTTSISNTHHARVTLTGQPHGASTNTTRPMALMAVLNTSSHWFRSTSPDVCWFTMNTSSHTNVSSGSWRSADAICDQVYDHAYDTNTSATRLTWCAASVRRSSCSA